MVGGFISFRWIRVSIIISYLRIFGRLLGDLNETYFVGNVDETSRQLVQCTYECLEKAIAIGMVSFLISSTAVGLFHYSFKM